ncbi:MAG TPA: type II toxin-antitoxin system VapC family toxin [Acidimicrobiales bacterium]|nr:type II toxin-antitoxin system VapC family toxin [Acidimicrobiales bacterium]
MSAVVIDASAGAEIVTDTRRGRALAGLLPADAEGWVPQHFYAEVLAVIRRRALFDTGLSEAQGAVAVGRLAAWHVHKVALDPMVVSAWAYRHNMTAADALYVVLAERLAADFLTDDHNLVDGPTFPRSIRALRLPR